MSRAMSTLVVIRGSAPGRKKKIEKIERWFQRRGIESPLVTEKLRTMVAAFGSTTDTVLAIVISPKDLEKLSARLREAAAARRRANSTLRDSWESTRAGGWPQRKILPVCHPLRGATFIVLAEKKIPKDALPEGVKTFTLSEEVAAMAAVAEAIAPKRP